MSVNETEWPAKVADRKSYGKCQLIHHTVFLEVPVAQVKRWKTALIACDARLTSEAVVMENHRATKGFGYETSAWTVLA